VQPVFLEVLDQGAAGAVNDAFRLTGRSRREHDEQRMVEGETLPSIKLASPAGSNEIAQAMQLRCAGRDRAVIQRDDRGETRQSRGNLGNALADRIGGVVRRRRNMRHHLDGIELGKPAEDREAAHLGCAARKYGADRRCCQSRDDGLAAVARHGDDAVARSHTEPAESGRQPQHSLAQRAPGQAVPPTALGDAGQRWRVVKLPAADQRLGIVQPEPGE
jgi:hypothetical protein